MNYGKIALKLHKKYHGKLESKSKVKLRNKADLSWAYTPGVAEVSSKIGENKALAREYTLKHNTVAIVSDGSAILGLGNLGAEAAIPVMEGKAVLFKEFADVDAVPICLATQDTEEIIKTVKYLAPSFGGINLEDIAAPRCFEIEQRLRSELDIPVMHDDQHGTAVVVLAALINALKVKKMQKQNAKIVINGAGAAGFAVTQLLLEYGVKEIIVCDSNGTIYQGRGGLNYEKELMAQKTNQNKVIGTLADAIKDADVFIGLSKGGVLKAEMVELMHEKPAIFALANPTPEIMPDAAKKAGAFVVATGRSDFPNQINNVLAFPGIFRGALSNKIKQFDDQMFMKAAIALAKCVARPTPDKILPAVFDKSIVKSVAKSIK